MNPRVPVGQRLTALRELEGATQTEVAKRLGVGQGMISKIEKGERPFPADLVDRASEAYGLPRAFFFVPPSILGASPPTFRKHSDARVADERRVARLYKEAARAFELASELSGYHESLLPAELADETPEAAAVRVRSLVGVGEREPIRNSARLLERLGFGVVMDLDRGDIAEDPKHAGISIPTLGASRPLVALAKPMRGEDQRLTLAHELGHHIWDRELARPLTSTRAPEERRAYEFAGALLMPREMIAERVTEDLNLVGFLPIKAEYGVGVDAIIMRAKSLGVLSPERVRSLFIQRSSRGWRNAEPVEVSQERPLLFGQAMERAVGLTQRAVEALTSLPASMVFQWMERAPEPEAVVDLTAWRARREGK